MEYMRIVEIPKELITNEKSELKNKRLISQ